MGLDSGLDFSSIPSGLLLDVASFFCLFGGLLNGIFLLLFFGNELKNNA